MNWHEKNPSSDCCLIVEGKRFYVGKHYLAMHSSYFGALFHGGFKESEMDEIELNDINSEDFTMMLNVLHGLEALGKSNIFPVLGYAHLYDMKYLLAECEQFLINSRKDARLDCLLVVADNYGLDKLKQIGMNEVVGSDFINSRRIGRLKRQAFWSAISENLKNEILDVLLSKHRTNDSSVDKLLRHLQNLNIVVRDATGEFKAAAAAVSDVAAAHLSDER